MILIARAPVRISLGGEGTDLPAYYDRRGGLVVSATINYYVYTILTPGWSDRLQIMSADHRTFSQQSACDDSIQGDGLRLPKAIARYFNIRDGLTVFLASQIPSGAGLGSSGSVAASMIKALAFWCGLDLGPAEVAELACYIEIERLGMPVGKQNQYASAFGGLNYITFSRGGVTVEPLRVSAGTRDALERGLMLFFTGTSSQSSAILRCQQEASQQGDEETIQRLDVIKELGLEIRTMLERGDLESFGTLLHRSWMEKRCLAEGVTTPFLDQCYQTARDNGALGGKVTGAGGGGFLMLYCPVERQEAVTEALEILGLQRFPFAFEQQGVDVMQAMPWPRQQAPNVLSFINGRSPENEMSIFAAPVIGQTQLTM
ncbi:MAG: GHMP kinase [Chloroflexi bacterium]|nr:MAG: GHMP kinase [Chloroflexota bacterium]RLC77438.1 MAG: GHMP kinase [Chloroflexota bacterium]